MSDAFDTSKTFADLGLHSDVLKGVNEAGFKHPTDIQATLIPAVLTGSDVIGQAKTGTGKTAAFALPLLHLIEKNQPMAALILTPTRELAVQVAAEIDQLGRGTTIHTACIIGGESMRQQQKQIDKGAQILVGTPGRVMDMQSRGQINFKHLRFAILDEVDRMLDIGFREDIRRILKSITCDHQTVFVSATMDKNIERLARSFMKADAKKLTTVSGSLTVQMVDQQYLSVEPWDKRTLLLHLLRHEDPATTLVFCRTKATVRKVTQYLCDKGIHAQEIHGDLHQKKRTRVMDSMRQGKLNVLIASDLAARGLDVEHITHVINYDLPEDPDAYVHRIGRTARAGRRGTAWSFVTPDEGQRLSDIEKLTGAMIEQKMSPQYNPGPVPSDINDQRQREKKRLKKKTTDRIPTMVSVDRLSDAEKARLFPNGIVPDNRRRRSTTSSRLRRRGR